MYRSGYRIRRKGAFPGTNAAHYPETAASGPLAPGSPILSFDGSDTDRFQNMFRTDGVEFDPWENLGSLGSPANITQVNVPQRGIFRSVAGAGKINNLPGVSGDGNQYFKSVPFANVPQPLTYGIVFMVVSSAATECLFQGGIFGINGHGIFHIGTEIYLNANGFVATGKHVQSGKWHMLTVEINGAASFVRLDGSQSANVNPGADPLGGAALLAESGAANKMTGRIARFLAYDQTQQTAAGLESYFMDRYGAGFPQ